MAAAQDRAVPVAVAAMVAMAGQRLPLAATVVTAAKVAMGRRPVAAVLAAMAAMETAFLDLRSTVRMERMAVMGRHWIQQAGPT